jgi:hypothetical protein
MLRLVVIAKNRHIAIFENEFGLRLRPVTAEQRAKAQEAHQEHCPSRWLGNALDLVDIAEKDKAVTSLLGLDVAEQPGVLRQRPENSSKMST